MDGRLADPGHEHGCYRHEALFYSGLESFLAGTLPFVEEGVVRGEAILVVLPEARCRALERELGAAARSVRFADMADVGANPARIIPAWSEFVDDHPGRPLRGIGEPIWAGRSGPELAECQIHEALLNLLFHERDFTLLCPYDADALDADVLDAARRTHPYLRHDGASVESTSFAGLDQLAAPSDSPLGPVPAQAVALRFGPDELHQVRCVVADHAELAGLDARRSFDLVLAASEIAANSIRHGGGGGTLQLWLDGSGLVCQIEDDGRILDPLAGRRRPQLDAECGRGLWMANALCELVQVRSSATGTVVRLHMSGAGASRVA